MTLPDHVIIINQSDSNLTYIFHKAETILELQLDARHITT